MSFIFRDNRRQSSESAQREREKTIFVRVNPDFKKIKKFVIAFVIVVFALVLISQSVYIVREDEVAIVRVLGEIKKIVVSPDHEADAIAQSALDDRFKGVPIDTEKGLKFMIPFITNVEKNSAKLITYVSNTAKINTRDKIKYDIDIYAQWQITHPGMFRASLGTLSRANSKIDEVVYAVVIDRINRLTSMDFLNNKKALEDILSDARVDLNENLASQGIRIVDIDVYRTVIPASNIDSTYKKMIAEREAIAQQIRAEGLELYNNTVADTDKQVAQTLASAIEEAEKIKGQADAEALSIYASAFSKDPEFYEFWRTLKSYERTLNENTYLFLDKNNRYLKIFSGQFEQGAGEYKETKE
ncbi:MAG: protease modulator HflC [Bacillota bacterium]|nr:protease modulator HflC [Bacillota bacterium]